jgi:hypothetical protein
MRSRYRILLFLVLMACSLVMVGVVDAVVIPIPNASFETPALSDAVPYTSTAAELLPWVGQWAAYYKASPYYAAFGEGQVTNPDSFNVGYLNPTGSFRPFLYQTLTDLFQEGNDYTLTVAAEMYNTAGNEGQLLSIQLGYWTGDPDGNVGPTIVAERKIASSELMSATMIDFSTSSGAVSGDAVGKPIVVFIGRASDSTTGPQWSVDNVRLTAVPEPGAIALLACGLFSLMTYACRKQK